MNHLTGWPASGHLVAAAILAAILLAIPARLRYGRMRLAEGRYRAFISKLAQADYAGAGGEIQAAISLAPDNAYYPASRGLLDSIQATAGVTLPDFLAGNPSLVGADNARVHSAIGSYRDALKLNPTDASWYHNLGWLYWAAGRRGEAAECLRKATALGGGEYLFHVSLGLLHEAEGLKDEAFAEYKTALLLHPGILDSQFISDLQSRSPAETRRIVEEAASSLREEVGRGGDPILRAKLGKILLHAGANDEALVHLRQVTAELPSLSRAWSNLGRSYELMGNVREAAACYEKARFLDPADHVPWLLLGRLAEGWPGASSPLRYYEGALRSWLDLTSRHAGRVSRLYLAQPPVANDVVPQWLLPYCEPALDAPAICKKIIRNYIDKGEREIALKVESACTNKKYFYF